MFNSKFTNFQVTETERGSGLYNLTVTAGYQWDDGTNTYKGGDYTEERASFTVTITNFEK
ncbi:hypothetical protein [Malacoplasma iowae]|uniref:hypothetical protein n=1 Tax=Malacoplasma iowae TaxID=2116 RepID=UPI0038732761|nr:hypothetical protein QX181_03005 [Malacoplasma iowae]